MIVHLSAEDAICASSVATLQMLRKIAKARGSDHGAVSARGMRERWADGIHGAMAEIALSRALRLPWTPGGLSISKGDVDNKIEVRATEHNTGHLLIYRSDPLDNLFVLMVGHFPDFRVAGGIYGRNVEASWWRDSDPGCWWVPQSALTNII